MILQRASIARDIVVGVTILSIISFAFGYRQAGLKNNKDLLENQAALNKLKDSIESKDKKIKYFAKRLEEKDKESVIAKEKADVINSEAEALKNEYNKLVHKIKNKTDNKNNDNETKDDVTPIEVVIAANKVIEKQDQEIKQLNIAYSSVFDAKIAAENMIKEYQLKEEVFKQTIQTQTQINNDLSIQIKKQTSQNRLWFAVGTIATVFVVTKYATRRN